MPKQLKNTPVDLPPRKTWQQWFTDREHRPIEIMPLRASRRGVWKRRQVKQPRWMRCVRPGDVLENRAGTQRVVRSVMYYEDGLLHSVNCTIMHCSWTHACHTILEAHRLRREGFRRVAAVALSTRLDKKIDRDCRVWGSKRVDCCDVRGVR